MRQVLAAVTRNRRVMPETHCLRLFAPEIARAGQPGQFVHLRVSQSWDPLLRRPMSLFRLLDEEIEVLVRAVGAGSRLLCRLPEGAEVDCLGPLGQGFRIGPRDRHLLLVGGGYGVAALMPLAERAVREGREVVLCMGAQTAEQLLPGHEVPPEAEYRVATDDGSAGHHGFVTDLAPELLPWADAVFACGPHPMLATLADLARRLAPRKSVQCALEAYMACGIGVCLSCVVPTRHGYRLVCKDGPVMEAREVVW